MIIQDQNFLPSDAPVDHGFFTRQDGVSTGIFASLNCGPGSGDDTVSVEENRRRVAQEMGVAAGNLLSVYQFHSAVCVFADAPFLERPQADAMVTDKPGLALGVLTADCAPVLLHGLRSDGQAVIGAAHSGWGGALKGVLQNTVQAMQQRGAALSTLRASIGPCIGPKSYEVREDFCTPFLEQDEQNGHFFKTARRPGHLMFDLAGYAARQLSNAGVRHVSITGIDTNADDARFFSYRRATQRNEAQYGRQISCIAISE